MAIPNRMAIFFVTKIHFQEYSFTGIEVLRSLPRLIYLSITLKLTGIKLVNLETMSGSNFNNPKGFFIVFSSLICYILIGIASLLFVLGLFAILFGKGPQNLELGFGSDKELGLIASCIAILILLINLPYGFPLYKRKKRIMLGINSLKNEISLSRLFYWVDLVFIVLIIAMAAGELSDEKVIDPRYLVNISCLLLVPVFHFLISLNRFRKLRKERFEEDEDMVILNSSK